MKKLFSLLFTLISFISFAQRKELRSAEKKFASGDIVGAEEILKRNVALFENAKSRIKNAYIFLQGEIAQANGDFETGSKKYKSLKNTSLWGKAEKQLQVLVGELVNSAIEDNEQKNYKSASEKLHLSYKLHPDNIDYLYYAASSAINAEDYDTALLYYKELKDRKYEGITTKYYVTEVATGNEREVTKTEYDIFKKSKDYVDLREEETPSKFPEIVKNIALIYAQKGDNEKAIVAVREARKSNPDDLNLILTEADIYIELEEKGKFEKLMHEAIEKDPDNPTLYFNLGVINADLKNTEIAKKYYTKAIELDKRYEPPYLNLVALILKGESAIVDEMNSLGNSKADNARYDVLKIEREGLYRQCIPILKELIAINKNEDAIKTLMNIYGTLGDNEGYKEMKALVEN